MLSRPYRIAVHEIMDLTKPVENNIAPKSEEADGVEWVDVVVVMI